MKSKLHKTLFPLQFAVVGFILIMEGYQVAMDKDNLLGWLISVLGLMAIAYFIYIKRTKKSEMLLEAFVFLLQGLALFLMGIVVLQSGKVWLPYLSFLAGVGYLLSGMISFIQVRKSKKSIPIK